MINNSTMKMMKLLTIQRGVYFLGIFFSASTVAVTKMPQAESISFKNEEVELLELLEEQTQIATKTRLNADFVPGMVTVLSGKELELKGLHTVWHALGIVPGMNIGIDKIGSRIVQVRGVGGSFASGNLKIMLNDVPMNSGYFALVQPVMNMPIQQVERIEIIRGPGSAIHGEYAYAGVINVITKNKDKNMFVGIGENQESLLGGVYSWEIPEKEFSASINLALSKTNGIETQNSSDALFETGASIGMGQQGVSNAPGSSSEGRNYHSILFNLDYAEYTFKLHWLNDKHDAHFGTFDLLPNENEEYENEFKTLELIRKISWLDNLNADFQFGWAEYINKFDITLLPAGFSLWHYPTFPLVLKDGYPAKGDYKEHKLYTGVDIFWDISSQHSLLMGFDYSQVKVKEAWHKTNIHPNGTLTYADDYILDSLIKVTSKDGARLPPNGKKRGVASLTFQDEYQPFQAMLITAGMRFDHYDDVGSKFSPRIAAVYRLSERHIIKGQYAGAFRPPTFYELAWAPDLSPQTIKTSDFGYIYKGINDNVRITVFHSELKNAITAGDPLSYKSSDGAVIKGIEVEMVHIFSDEFSTSFNLSYADSKDNITDKPIPGTTDWLSNIEWLYQPSEFYDFSLRYHYVGKQYRDVNDAREKLAAYGVVAFSASYSGFQNKRIIIQAGVENLFNEEVRYPAPMTIDMTGTSFPTYENDYPRAGRRWWFQFKYQFN